MSEPSDATGRATPTPASSHRPSAPSSGRRPRPQAARRRAVRRLPPLRILLADDSPDNQLLIRAYLRPTRSQVEIAADGAAAVEKFRRGRYDVVLMDVQMPVMDGCEATRTIRLWERANDRAPTPVVALTADDGKAARDESLAAGCSAHLIKPIAKAALLETIRDVCVGTGHGA